MPTPQETSVAKLNTIVADYDSDLAAIDEAKADKNGTYDDMTVGNAKQLVSTVGIENKTPYNFRTTGGSVDVGDRVDVKEITGGTVAWNQHCGSSSETITQNGITIAFDKTTGKTTVTVGESPTGYAQLTFNTALSVSAGHKVLLFADKVLPNGFEFYSSRTQGGVRGSYPSPRNISTIVEASNQTTNAIMLFVGQSTASGTYEVMLNYIDLTLMFGSAIADAIYAMEQAQAGDGVAFFKALFPKPYYAYDAGSLKSVKTSAHKEIEFNQWDEEWENGYINVQGQDVADSTRIRSKNYIPVLPSTTYYFKDTAVSWARRAEYDANNNLVAYEVQAQNSTFTTTANTAYIRFALDGTTYNHDICINLHWDGERDGEYEAYEENAYALDSDLELRGIPKLDANNNLYYDGDIYESDGTVTRNFISTSVPSKSSWTMQAAGIFRSNLDRVFGYTHNVFLGNYARYTSGYSTGSNISTLAAANDRAIFCNSGSATFFVSDSRYSTVDDFYNAIKDMELIYQTTAPTTESADPYQQTQICNDFGTEEFVDTREVPIPVGSVSVYNPNLRAKLEMAPNSPNGDGDYIVRQTSGTNEYVDISTNSTIAGLLTRVPVASGADGNYVLKASISGGVVTYSWVAE